MQTNLQFSVRNGKSKLIISPSEIIRIESVSNYSRIYLLNHPHPLIVAKVLRRFEESLPREMFVRIHRTHLINKNFIDKVNHGKTPTICLTNGECIAISRRKKQTAVQLTAA